MDYIAELAAIAKEHGGIIETTIAAQPGLSKAMLDVYKRQIGTSPPTIPVPVISPALKLFVIVQVLVVLGYRPVRPPTFA